MADSISNATNFKLKPSTHSSSFISTTQSSSSLLKRTLAQSAGYTKLRRDGEVKFYKTMYRRLGWQSNFTIVFRYCESSPPMNPAMKAFINFPLAL